MLHAKFHGNQTIGSGRFFKDFYHIWVWQSWSCDPEGRCLSIVDTGPWVYYKLTYEPLAQVS